MNNTTANTHVHRGVLATIIIVVATALGLVSLTASGASAEHRADGPKPTIVLVHGGWADSSGWNAQVAALQRRGYPVIAPANPLRSIASDAAYIRSVLTTIDGPIVLVGHSYGGAVITNAAVGVSNVKALVYIAGFAPDDGESLVQLVTMNPGSEIGPATLIPRPYPLPVEAKEPTFTSPRKGSAPPSPATFPPGSPTRCRPHSGPSPRRPSRSLSGEPAWKTIPSWYLVATQDKAIPPATQRFMAERAGATVDEVRASHVPMISKPDATTRLILDAANAIS